MPEALTRTEALENAARCLREIHSNFTNPAGDFIADGPMYRVEWRQMAAALERLDAATSTAGEPDA